MEEEQTQGGEKRPEGMEMLQNISGAFGEMSKNIPPAFKNMFPSIAAMEGLAQMIGSLKDSFAQNDVKGVGGNIPDGTQVTPPSVNGPMEDRGLTVGA